MINGDTCIQHFIENIKTRLSPFLGSLGFKEVKKLSCYEYYLHKAVFVKGELYISIDCEPTRGCGIDLCFGKITEGLTEKSYSLLTYLELIDPDQRSEFGYCLPKDSNEMEDLFKMYINLLADQKEHIIENTEKTLSWIESNLTIEFANSRVAVKDKFNGD